jgi:integrase
MNTATKLPRGIQMRGDSVVVYFTTADGKPVRRSMGRVTPKFAAQQREIWLREIAEGRYVKPVAVVEPVPVPVLLFSTICERAIESYKRHKRCWDVIQSRVAVFKEWFPSRAADSITTIEIDEHLQANTGEGHGAEWSKTTANEYRATLLRIYVLAIAKGLLTFNPAKNADRYLIKNRRKRVLSAKEEIALRAAITAKYPDKMPELDLSLHTGMRRSNIYGQHNKNREHMDPLNWDDVSLDFRMISLKRSKSGEGYNVPLNQTALAALRVLRARGEGKGDVVRKPSGLALKSCRKWFENCLTTAGIQDFRWHDLRHTFATRLRANGVQIEDIKHLLGHDIGSMTELYANPDMSLLLKAVQTLDSTVTETVTPNVAEFRTSAVA